MAFETVYVWRGLIFSLGVITNEDAGVVLEQLKEMRVRFIQYLLILKLHCSKDIFLTFSICQDWSNLI